MKANILLKMVQSIMDSGRGVPAMDSVNNLGKMEQGTKVSGMKTRLMGVACFTTWMEMCSMASGTKTRPTASAPTST